VITSPNKFASNNSPTVDGCARKQERDEQPIMLKQVKSICQSCLGGTSELSIKSAALHQKNQSRAAEQPGSFSRRSLLAYLARNEAADRF
jgi:hypothetical protein